MKNLIKIIYPNPAKPLSPQGLFISSMTPKPPQTPSNTWHHYDPLTPILSHFSCQNKSQIYFNPQQSQTTTFFCFTDTNIPQRNYQILRSLSPSRMPLARLNLSAICCQSSGI
jgi:hypothetical protein